MGATPVAPRGRVWLGTYHLTVTGKTTLCGQRMAEADLWLGHVVEPGDEECGACRGDYSLTGEIPDQESLL